MATFYLLPPRQVVGEHFSSFLGAFFPGLAWPNRSKSDLAETLSEAANAHPGVYVVYQEDLAEDALPATALLRDFGAEGGDEVVEVRPNPAGQLTETGRWHLASV